jgi:hypothetical protein
MRNRKTRTSLSAALLAAAIALAPAITYAQPPTTPSDADGNTAAGTDALLNVTVGGFGVGHSNTAIGKSALKFNTDGRSNTALGFQGLVNNTTGNFNTASGYNALFSNSTGLGNTASGAIALFNNTTGEQNTANGIQALNFNTTGSFNTASGSLTLRHSSTGSNNTAVGYEALYAQTTGTGNTALGYRALKAKLTGNNNVAVGLNALVALTDGASNIALGVGAGRLTTTGDSNIYIGHPGINGDESAVMRLGRAQTMTFMAGVAGVPLSGATVVVKSNGQFGVVASSERYKQDITVLDRRADKLSQLRPVSYSYKAEPGVIHYGLIAEEVEQVMPELVVRDSESRPESIAYQELIPLLLREQQAQREIIAQQHERLERQEMELVRLRQTLDTRLAAHQALK